MEPLYFFLHKEIEPDYISQIIDNAIINTARLAIQNDGKVVSDDVDADIYYLHELRDRIRESIIK